MHLAQSGSRLEIESGISLASAETHPSTELDVWIVKVVIRLGTEV